VRVEQTCQTAAQQHEAQQHVRDWHALVQLLHGDTAVCALRAE
jgi:hypothetical protein